PFPINLEDLCSRASCGAAGPAAALVAAPATYSAAGASAPECTVVLDWTLAR
ncbi:MAG: hypothetical protein QOJ89_4453, partial [bacterium]